MSGSATRATTTSRAAEHLRAVSRVYGPETWDVYELLDQSLEPRGPDSLPALALERLQPGSVVLDIGCRDASYLIELVRESGARGVGIDPVNRLVEQARQAVAEAGLQDRIDIAAGVLQELPYPDESFDLVWCRDVLELVERLDAGVKEIARVLRPDGQVIVFTVVATDRLEPREAELLLGQNLTIVSSNLDEENLLGAFARAGLAVELRDAIGTEWREHAEERTHPVSRDLLRLARLRRQRDRVVAEAGEEIYRHLESNLHWSVYQFLGKLLPVVYVLRRAAG